MSSFKSSLKAVFLTLFFALFTTFIACEDGDRTGSGVTSGDPGLPIYTVTYEIDGVKYDKNTSHAKITGKTVQEGASVKADDKVFEGTEIVFTAIPNDGYECDYTTWTGATSSTGRKTDPVTANSDITIGIDTIQLSSTMYNVIFNQPANGKLSASTPAGTPVVSGTPEEGELSEVNDGTTVTFKASPNDGYKVQSWTVAGTVQTGETDEKLEVVVTADVTVAVTFVEE